MIKFKEGDIITCDYNGYSDKLLRQFICYCETAGRVRYQTYYGEIYEAGAEYFRLATPEEAAQFVAKRITR